MTAPQSISVEYQIGTGPFSWEVPLWEKDENCNFDETLSLAPNDKSWLSFEERRITILTADLELETNAPIVLTLTATLNDSVGTSDSGYQISITLSNPCKYATLNAP